MRGFWKIYVKLWRLIYSLRGGRKGAYGGGLRLRSKASEELKAKYEEKLAVTADILSKWTEDNGLSMEEACSIVNDSVEKVVNKFNRGEMDEDFFEGWAEIGDKNRRIGDAVRDLMETGELVDFRKMKIKIAQVPIDFDWHGG